MPLLAYSLGEIRLTDSTPPTDNIEYDQIKYYIKEQTTPGNGKAVAIPGRGEVDKALEFEDKLHQILADSYANITLFVKSKSGEIRSRLGKADLNRACFIGRLDQ